MPPGVPQMPSNRDSTLGDIHPIVLHAAEPTHMIHHPHQRLAEAATSAALLFESLDHYGSCGGIEMREMPCSSATVWRAGTH